MSKSRYRYLAVCSLFVGIPFTYAGGMGDAQKSLPNMIPYIGLEGSYTWNQLGAITINSNINSETNDGFGGRLSLGFIHPFTTALDFSLEFGGGYYGRTKVSSPLAGTNGQMTIDGYDLLGGAAYKIKQLEIFGKLGVMSQNLRSKITRNNSRAVPGGLLSGTETFRINQTQSLPEIKVGLAYGMLRESFNVTLSYMHVFGNNLKINNTITAVPGAITASGNSNTQNPTLDSIMLGLRYSFS